MNRRPEFGPGGGRIDDRAATFGKLFRTFPRSRFPGHSCQRTRVHSSYTVKDGRLPTTVLIRKQQMPGAVCSGPVAKTFFPAIGFLRPTTACSVMSAARCNAPLPAPNHGRGRANVRYRVPTVPIAAINRVFEIIFTFVIIDNGQYLENK